MRSRSSLLVGALLATSCATVAVPNQEVAAVQAILKRADAAKVATQSEQAARHLQLAKSQLAEAQGLIQQMENEHARLMLIRANADAELAIALADQDTTRAEAQKVMDQVKAIKGQ